MSLSFLIGVLSIVGFVVSFARDFLKADDSSDKPKWRITVGLAFVLLIIDVSVETGNRTAERESRDAATAQQLYEDKRQRAEEAQQESKELARHAEEKQAADAIRSSVQLPNSETTAALQRLETAAQLLPAELQRQFRTQRQPIQSSLTSLTKVAASERVHGELLFVQRSVFGIKPQKWQQGYLGSRRQ